MSPDIEIAAAVSKIDLEQVRELFREYFAWVQDDLRFDLGYQAIDKELMTLPGAYASPQGCLLLARGSGKPVGCIALRPHSLEICELKRMYVRPDFRGQGIGRMLCAQIIQVAKLAGYSLMRLDTEISLSGAQKIYRDFGFHSASPYYEAPEVVRDRTIFMELNLV